MWIEAILVEDDINRLLGQLMPLSFDVGSAGDRVVLSDPRQVTFVAGEGVRLECEAKVRWTVAGIPVPFTVHDVRAMLRPEVVKGVDGRDSLAFSLLIEHADFAAIPTIVDERITDKVNDALRTHMALSWNFSEMLSRSVDLPESLHPLRRLSLEVAWGKLRVTDEAVVMAISFHSSCFGRESVPAPAPLAARPQRVETLVTTRGASPTGASAMLAGGALLALVSGGVYGGYLLGGRQRIRGSRGALAVGAALTTFWVATKLGSSALRAAKSNGN